MKKYLPVILVLCVVKFSVHFFGNQNYGFQRDELLHLSVSEHPGWGYMEFPPFIAWVGKVSHAVFGYSLEGARVAPTLAGIGIVVLCCLMAIEFGGQMTAVFLAGLCVLCFLPFYRNQTLFQPVAFDQLFWTAGFYFLVKFLRTEKRTWLLLIGVVSGLGILNKYTFLVWCAALVLGLVFYNRGAAFKYRELYIAGLVGVLMVLPNVVWQYNHHFPLIKHFQRLSEVQLDDQSPFEFLLDQVEYPVTLIISLVGLISFFIYKPLKKFKPVAVMVIGIFLLMWIMKSKAYYFFAAYPVLFAAGAARLEAFFVGRKWMIYATAFLLLLFSVPFVPRLTPVLPIEDFVSYRGLKPEVNGRIKLSGDYADMFGWEEQVKLVDSLYSSLSDEDKKRCILFAENYGEAGAIKILGKKYGLPDPVCVSGSFWLMGPGTIPPDIAICIGVEEPVLKQLYNERKLIRKIYHRYAVDEENNIPVYVCREPIVDLRKIWPDLESHIFD